MKRLNAIWLVAALAAFASGAEPVTLAEGDAEGVVLVGDMLLEPGQALLSAGLPRRGKRVRGLAALARPGTKPWPAGRVPVEFDPDITEEERAFFFESAREWETRVNVRFVAREDGEVAIKVVRGKGCHSRVGYGAGFLFWFKERTLSLAGSLGGAGSTCWTRGVIVHELGHALGLMHEHMRPDRDGYITVLWDNIQKNQHSQYHRIEGYTFGLPYDFDSIMHYWNGSFAKPGKQNTFLGKPGYEDQAARAGHARAPSELDARGLQGWYGAPRSVSFDVASGPATLE